MEIQVANCVKDQNLVLALKCCWKKKPAEVTELGAQDFPKLFHACVANNRDFFRTFCLKFLTLKIQKIRAEMLQSDCAILEAIN